jgi:acetoin utilization protein AcuB
MRLDTIMTKPVETISPRASISTAQRVLRLKGIHHLVVVSRANVVGLATAETLKDREAEGAARVGDAMIRNITVLAPETTVRQAADLMMGRPQTAVPVVRHQRLVGIVTVSDLLDLAGTPRPRHRSATAIAAKRISRVAGR